MDLTFDLPGKIRNTRLYSSQGLKPLFEAVANSIQSIEDAKEPNGLIQIRIDRGAQTTISGESNLTLPVQTLVITDNGIGFTESNYKSFHTADSTFKVARGCKGVGRFIWLKAFRHAEIESQYRESGKNWKRTFRFEPTPKGFEKESLVPSDSTVRTTTIRLVGMRERFQDASPKTAETIAQRVVEYCLPHFVQKKAPRIVLIDSDGTEHDLNSIYQEMQFYQKAETFKINNQKFQIMHLLVPASRDQVHRLHLCANGWSVKPEPLADKLPELRSASSPIRDLGNGGRQLFYAGFLSGELLDESVSAERMDFALDDEPGMFGSGDEVTKPMLMEKVVEKVNRYLTPHLQEIRTLRDEQVKEHVFTRSPQYRPLLKHRPEFVSDIPPNLTPDKLELKLYEANQRYNVELSSRPKVF